MANVLDSGSGGELNPGFGGGGPVATAIAVVRQPQINFSGANDALSAQTTYGFDQVSGEARVVCVTPTGNLGDNVSLTFGATNYAQRFSGPIASIDTTLSPHSVMIVGKGPLSAIEEYENGTETIFSGDGSGRPGLAFEDLVGTSAGATLREIVAAVLSLSGAPALNGASDDPSHIYGLLADEEFTWGTYETAASYLHKILEASAGYRLFDSSDGNVYLKQISAIPAGGADFTLTLGQDIFGDGQHSTTSIGKRTGVLVEGYDYDGTGPATSGIVGSTGSVFRISSTLIETDSFATEIANFWLPQVNRPQELIRLSTPQDYLFGPAQTHFISGLSSDQLWLKSVTTEITSNGDFTQHMTYVSGA